MNELMVIVSIGSRRCAIRAHDVQSVIEIDSISPIPRCAPHIVGLTALRSQALTVIDCRLALALPQGGLPTDHRAAVVKVSGHSYALLVDLVEGVEEPLCEPGQVTGGFGGEWARVGMGMVETASGPVLQLDVGKLVAGCTHAAKAA